MVDTTLPQPRDALGDARYAESLALAFAGLAALTFGLIVLGALVRAHGAGLACPDWPLCFGEFVPELDLKVLEAPEEESKKGGGGSGDDELFDEAARLVVAERQASASFLQRRMRVGFSRAARLIDIMEQEGLLGPPQGSKPREVLVPVDYFEEVDSTQAEWEA